MPVNDVYQVRIVSGYGNQVGMNIRYYVVNNVVGIEFTPADLAVTVDMAIAAAYKALLSTSSFYRGVGAKLIWPTQGIEFSTIASLGAGTVAGDVLPPQTAGLIGLQTLKPGPEGHGRMYIPWPSETDNGATGLPIAGYGTRLNTLGALMTLNVLKTAGGNTTTWAPCLFRKDTLNATKLITNGYYSRTGWASQRRRGAFGAANVLPF